MTPNHAAATADGRMARGVCYRVGNTKEKSNKTTTEKKTMPYYVTCDRRIVKSFNNKADAFKFIDKETNLWAMQGFKVPCYQVWYGGEEVKR